MKRFFSMKNDIISFQLSRHCQFLKNDDKYVICRSRQETTVMVMVNIFILLTKPKKIVVCFMVCQLNISIRPSNY